MTKSNFKLLTGKECTSLIRNLTGVFVLNNHIWDKPIQYDTTSIGVVNGLEISLKTIFNLKKYFDDDEVYFFSQNMLNKDSFSIVSAFLEGEDEHLPLKYAYLWSSENLAIFGESMEWFVLFNAELSIAIILTRKSQSLVDLVKVRREIEQYESLCSISDVLPLIEDDLALYDNSNGISKKLLSLYN